MEFKELKKKTEGDLHKLLEVTRDKLRDLRFKDANKQLKNVREIRTVRQTIARILMLLKSNKPSKQKTVNKPAADKAKTSGPEKEKKEKK